MRRIPSDLWLGVAVAILALIATVGFRESQSYLEKLLSNSKVEATYSIFFAVLAFIFLVAPAVRSYSAMKKDPDSPYMVLLSRIYAIAKLAGVEVRARGTANVLLVLFFNGLYALAYIRYFLVDLRFNRFQDKKKNLPKRPPIVDQRVVASPTVEVSTLATPKQMVESSALDRILRRLGCLSLFVAAILAGLIGRTMFLEADQSRGLFQLALGLVAGRSPYHLALGIVLLLLCSGYLLYQGIFYEFPHLLTKTTVKEDRREHPPLAERYQPRRGALARRLFRNRRSRKRRRRKRRRRDDDPPGYRPA